MLATTVESVEVKRANIGPSPNLMSSGARMHHASALGSTNNSQVLKKGLQTMKVATKKRPETKQAAENSLGISSP